MKSSGRASKWAFRALVVHVDDLKPEAFIAEAQATLESAGIEIGGPTTVDSTPQGESCMTLPYELPLGMDRTG